MGKEKIKRYYATFSCGHKGYIQYFGRNDLLVKLEKAEHDGLCPICKEKEFKKNSVLVIMPYKEYKSKYYRKRGVMTGKYNRNNNTIEVYLDDKKAKQYNSERNKVWYDAEFCGYDTDGNTVITLFLRGNSYVIKDKLKELGYKWENKKWCKQLAVFPTPNSDGSKWLPPEDNTLFYDEVNELEKIGCIDGLRLIL